MDIANSLEFLKKHGANAVDLEKLRLAASTLPDTNISLRMRGLDSQSSLVLMSRLLRDIAKRLDIEYRHPDVIGIAGLPIKEVPRSASVESSATEDDIKQEYAENDY